MAIMSDEISRSAAGMPVEQAGDKMIQYGCLFCRTGRETSVVQKLKALYPDIAAIAPTKLRYRRHGQEADEERVSLFPGYVFFQTVPEDERVFHFAKIEDVLRLLCYDKDNWQLSGADAAMSRTFFEVKGEVGFSKAYYEGDRIRIADGFLKQYEGQIIRVNRRAKTAEIRVEFQGKIFSLWLGFELIEPEALRQSQGCKPEDQPS